MKKTGIIALIICVSMIAIQCKSNKEATTSAENSATTLAEVDTIPFRKINIDPFYEWPGTTDQYTVLSSSCVGDTLKVEVQYGGGCEIHEWKMSTNRMWLKSMPPKLQLHLEHTSNNDMCRALITETLFFDLKPLQYPHSKQANFILNNEHQRAIEYKY